MYNRVTAEVGAVHICVNNAGMSHFVPLLQGTPEQWRQMLDVNVIAVCLLTKLVINGMKEHGIDDGHIVNINRLDCRCILFGL